MTDRRSFLVQLAAAAVAAVTARLGFRRRRPVPTGPVVAAVNLTGRPLAPGVTVSAVLAPPFPDRVLTAGSADPRAYRLFLIGPPGKG